MLPAPAGPTPQQLLSQVMARSAEAGGVPLEPSLETVAAKEVEFDTLLRVRYELEDVRNMLATVRGSWSHFHSRSTVCWLLGASDGVLVSVWFGSGCIMSSCVTVDRGNVCVMCVMRSHSGHRQLV